MARRAGLHRHRRLRRLLGLTLAKLIDPEKFWAALHESVGRCGHCGNRICEGQKDHSILPDRLKTEDVVAAMRRATSCNLHDIEMVVFDVDGVLVDSLTAHLDFCTLMNKELGMTLTIPSPTEMKESIHNGVKVSPMEHFFQAVGFWEEKVKLANEEYVRTFYDRCRPPVFEDTASLLARLREADLKLGIVSSNTVVNVTRSLGDLRMSYFEAGCVLTSESLGNGWNKAVALILLSKSLKIAAKRILYVGDQPADREAAQTAGTQFLAATYGWGFFPGENANEAASVSAIGDFVLGPDEI